MEKPVSRQPRTMMAAAGVRMPSGHGEGSFSRSKAMPEVVAL
jgi:hypothetical protein